MSFRRKKQLATLVALISCCLIGYALHAVAEGAPTTQPLWYAGTVSGPDGVPLKGNHQVWIRLFTQQSGLGAALCTSGPTTIPFDNGRFRVELASPCVDVVKGTPDVFVELSVDDDKLPFPRSKVGAVPYALEAEHAVSASEAVGSLKQAIERTPRITDWETYDPAVYVDGKLIANTSRYTAGRFRRVGDSIEVQGAVNDTSFLAGTGFIKFRLPNGLAPDLNKLVPHSKVGQGNAFTGGYSWLLLVAIDPVTGEVGLEFDAHSGPAYAFELTPTIPFTFASGGTIQFSYTSPVNGWTASSP
jgi:hypothetical protein